jgi:hypothetical protein
MTKVAMSNHKKEEELPPMQLSMFESCNVTHVAMSVMRLLQDGKQHLLRINPDDLVRVAVVSYDDTTQNIWMIHSNPSIVFNVGLPDTTMTADLIHFLAYDPKAVCVIVRSAFGFCIVLTTAQKQTWMTDGCSSQMLYSINLPKLEYASELAYKLSLRWYSRPYGKFRKFENGVSSWRESDFLDDAPISSKKVAPCDRNASHFMWISTGVEYQRDDKFNSVLNFNDDTKRTILRWNRRALQRCSFVRKNHLFQVWYWKRDSERDNVERKILEEEMPHLRFEDGAPSFDFVYLLDILAARTSSVLSVVAHEGLVIKSLRFSLLAMGALSLLQSTMIEDAKVNDYFQCYFECQWTKMSFFREVAGSLSKDKQRDCASLALDLLKHIMWSDGFEVYNTSFSPFRPKLLTAYQRFAHIYGFFMRFDSDNFLFNMWLTRI